MKKFITLILINLSFFTMANTIPTEKLIGQFNEKSDPDFIPLDATILPVNKIGMYLNREVAEQLIKAYRDFNKLHPDIPFVITSATRNYTYQNGIWTRKWNNLYPTFKNAQATAEEILKYSSMPGSSRHHWGTDIDITSFSSEYFHQTKKGKILYQWLQENMPKYGFCQPFNENRNGGYQTEEWHWSYQPIAKQYLYAYKKLIEKEPTTILNKMNFVGHDKIKLKSLISEYVLTINDKCY